MGEPLATLPPMVPAWRIGGEAKRSHTSVRRGHALRPGRRRRLRARRRRRCRARRRAAAARSSIGFSSATSPTVDDVAQVAELLVDPQADVGRAGQQLGGGLRFAQRGELGQGRGGAWKWSSRGPSGRRVVEGPGPRAAGLASACDHRRGVQPHGRQVEHALAGIEDRPVAGAAAQVARQVVGQLLPGGLGAAGLVVLVGRPQRHHEAGRAEAALRAVAVDHRLLDRVQPLHRVLLVPLSHRARGRHWVCASGPRP